MQKEKQGLPLRPRCCYCHEEFQGELFVKFCPDCGAQHHPDCWLDLGSCAACGQMDRYSKKVECGYCRKEVTEKDSKYTCDSCSENHHFDCFFSHGRCANCRVAVSSNMRRQLRKLQIGSGSSRIVSRFSEFDKKFAWSMILSLLTAIISTIMLFFIKQDINPGPVIGSSLAFLILCSFFKMINAWIDFFVYISTAKEAEHKTK